MVYSVVGALQRGILPYLHQEVDYYPHYPDEETEAQGGNVTCLGLTDSCNNSFKAVSAYATPGILLIFLWL